METMKPSQYRRGRTHRFPGDIPEGLRQAAREIRKPIKTWMVSLSRKAVKSLRKQEEEIINRKVRADKSYRIL